MEDLAIGGEIILQNLFCRSRVREVELIFGLSGTEGHAAKILWIAVIFWGP